MFKITYGLNTEELENYRESVVRFNEIRKQTPLEVLMTRKNKILRQAQGDSIHIFSDGKGLHGKQVNNPGGPYPTVPQPLLVRYGCMVLTVQVLVLLPVVDTIKEVKPCTLCLYTCMPVSLCLYCNQTLKNSF